MQFSKSGLPSKTYTCRNHFAVDPKPPPLAAEPKKLMQVGKTTGICMASRKTAKGYFPRLATGKKFQLEHAHSFEYKDAR